MKEEFLKMLSGQQNKFAICLENLKFGWNPDTRNIREAITFIQNLYISTFLTDNSRNQTAAAVFQNLLLGMNPRLKTITDYMLQRSSPYLATINLKL